MASVQLSDVSFGYGERALFCELDLELAQGKVTSIIGPNGCGKSSLLKLASGICKPWEGSIRVLGHDASALSSKERARLLSLLAQEHAAPPMSVRRLVEWITRQLTGRLRHAGLQSSPSTPWPSSPAGSVSVPSSPWSWRRMRPWCSSTSRPRFSTCRRATR